MHDLEKATVLGKALFFDVSVGSDGIQACASCHFHAGADIRAKNQLTLGLQHVLEERKGDPDSVFQLGGPDFTNASVRNAQRGQNVIEPMLVGDYRPALYDNGFYNIVVPPTVEDLGPGQSDPFGKPLAFSR